MIWNGYHNTGLTKLVVAEFSYRESTRRYTLTKKRRTLTSVEETKCHLLMHLSWAARQVNYVSEELKEGLKNEL